MPISNMKRKLLKMLKLMELIERAEKQVQILKMNKIVFKRNFPLLPESFDKDISFRERMIGIWGNRLQTLKAEL